MKVDALILDGAIKSFQKAIGLRMSWVVEKVGQVVSRAEVIEVLGEFSAVIGLDAPGGEGSHLKELSNKIGGIGGRIGLVGVSEGKSGAHIKSCKDITL